MGAATLVAIRKAKILNSESFQTGWDFKADPLQTAKNFSWSLFYFFPLVRIFRAILLLFLC